MSESIIGWFAFVSAIGVAVTWFAYEDFNHLMVSLLAMFACAEVLILRGGK